MSGERSISDKEMAHERLGDTFREALSDYDTRRRVEVLVNGFLPRDLKGKKALDVGCGLGFFSKALVERGAEVTAFDIGPSLVHKAKELAGCHGVVGDAVRLDEYFDESSFDIVLSSECIEHTPDPARCIAGMSVVLKTGGLLSLSTPNYLWWPVVRLSSALKLRPFEGLENFSSFKSLTRAVEQSNMQVLLKEGLHLFPFQLGAHRFSTWLDRHCQIMRHFMINLCVLATKRA